MIVYIAGPITGVMDYEKKFNEAERLLTEQGFTVLNPAWLPQGLGDCDDYMRICLPMIALADTVAMLDGWQDSRGACREWGYAKALDKYIIDIENLLGPQSTLSNVKGGV